MFFLTVIVFIFIVGILIFFHELFHFIVAKRNGVMVEEFCLGFPPRIFSKRKGSTIYSIGAIPLGGFVKLFGEESRQPLPNSFYGKPIAKRAKIVLAGVLANFFIAVILFSVIFASGVPEVVDEEIPQGAKEVFSQIVGVSKNSPAEKAGMRAGDRILKLSFEKEFIAPSTPAEIQNFVQGHKGKTITLTIKRGRKIFEKEVFVREHPPEKEGAIGVSLIKTAYVSYPWYLAILKGFSQAFILIGLIFKTLFEALRAAMIGQPIEGIELVGPIGIGGLLSRFLDLGWIYVFQFTAILSLNLAILNALPFPALDGGRLIFLLIEKIRKRPIKIEIENLVNRIGFALLLILMALVTIKDIQKLF